MEEIREEVVEETPEEPSATEKKEKKVSKKEKELNAKILELEGQIKERDDKYLRLAAEYDNFRRRSREEKDATYDNALADTVGELLPIIDNLERALSFSGDEKTAEGLAMIFKSVEASLAKLGVESFGAVGEKFDPNVHNAVMHVDDESFGENEVAEVFMKGYAKGDKVLRYSMVKVAN